MGGQQSEFLMATIKHLSAYERKKMVDTRGGKQWKLWLIE
jgi:hypothetical protein